MEKMEKLQAFYLYDDKPNGETEVKYKKDSNPLNILLFNIHKRPSDRKEGEILRCARFLMEEFDIPYKYGRYKVVANYVRKWVTFLETQNAF